MTRFASTIAGLLILSTAGAQAASIGPDEVRNLDAAVFKVRAEGPGGVVNNGSAVLIAPGKLVTTCHVTRMAQGIQLSRGGETWTSQTSFADIPHDLCVLSAPGLTGAVPAVLGALGDLNLGDRVTAVGYRPGGKLAVSGGHVKGLHPYDGAPVLQVSAPFDHGQSGGALFDAQGRLVGITAFKAVAGGDFHFALPLQWLPESALGDGLPVARDYDTGEKAFWERARGGQPLFLRAATLEADGKWEALSDVAQEWSRADYTNPASWLALGRALDRLKRVNEAAQAYARAALLGPSAVSRP